MQLGDLTWCSALLLAAGCAVATPTFDAGPRPDAGDGGFDAGIPASDCFDGRRNGDETDRDCGGSCPGCELGQICMVATDCRDNSCVSERCALPDCNDGAQNQDESDIDCGGSCDLCPEGSRCNDDADCSSDSCRGGVCAEASCDDGSFNGAETDVDCGGPTCPGCGDGRMCRRRDDCAAFVCTTGMCAPAACDDLIANGEETDRDCGGPVCRGCRDRQMCNVNGDCGSDVCTAGRCVGSGEFEEDFETGMLRTEWVNVSASPWTVSTTTPLTGTTSGRSGVITHSQQTNLDLPVTCAGAGMVTFRYRVSSESCCDFLRFFVDGTPQGQWGGTVPSNVHTVALTTGAHTLRWQYSKDSSVNTGEDAGFIDDVVVMNCSSP